MGLLGQPPSKEGKERIRWELSSFLLSFSSVLSRAVVGVGSYAAATATDIYPQDLRAGLSEGHSDTVFIL